MTWLVLRDCPPELSKTSTRLTLT